MMKKFGILINNFFFENFIFLFIVSKYFVLLSFFFSVIYNIKKNKKLFYAKLSYVYKSCFFLILFLFLFNLLNNVTVVNHIKFLLNSVLISFVISISLFYYKNPNIFKNTLYFFNLFNIIVILDIFIFKLFNFSILTNWNNYINSETLRYAGFFFDEKILGFYLNCSMPLILLYKNRYSDRLKKNNFLFIFLILNYVLAIYLTGERRSFLLSVLLFFLIIYNLEFSKLFNKKIIIITTIIFIFFSSLLCLKFYSSKNDEKKILNLNFRMINLTMDTIESIPLFFKNKEEYKKYIKQNDIGNWILLYDSAISIYKKDVKSIFIGIGFKNYKSKCLEQKENTCSTHPHQFLIEILISFGLVGFTILIYYLTKVIKLLYLNRNHSYEFIIFLFMFFFPFFPSGSIFSINLLSTLAVFSSIFIANHYIVKNV